MKLGYKDIECLLSSTLPSILGCNHTFTFTILQTLMFPNPIEEFSILHGNKLWAHLNSCDKTLLEFVTVGSSYNCRKTNHTFCLHKSYSSYVNPNPVDLKQRLHQTSAVLLHYHSWKRWKRLLPYMWDKNKNNHSTIAMKLQRIENNHIQESLSRRAAYLSYYQAWCNTRH